MDSEDDDGFAKQGGEALEMGDDFDDSEEEGMDEPQAQVRKQPEGSTVTVGEAAPPVKGQEVQNQPFDLAVDVNDSEEVESDEEDDEVNMELAQKRPEQKPQ